jgi:hypothetical protein
MRIFPLKIIFQINGLSKGEANGQLPIEILRFQDCLFIFELDSIYFFSFV